MKIQNGGKQIELKTLFEESSYNFLIQNKIKEVHLRIVLKYFDAEASNAQAHAIENMDCSALSDMILDPLKIGGRGDLDQNISRRGEGLFPHLSEEQKNIALATHSMRLDKNQPNIKLIEGPPGSGKSLIIQNLVLVLLHKNGLGRTPRILLCAENNTAVDTTLIKIMKKNRTLNVVRYGFDKHIHSEVRNYSINGFMTREWKKKYPTYVEQVSTLNTSFCRS